MRSVISLLTLCLMVWGALGTPAWAGTRTPLLQEGKKTLFQRVVSHPGARLYSGPGADATVIRDKVKTFTVYYVYARQGQRLEVGVSTQQPDGWLDVAAGTDWPQAITMVFTDRMGRMPVLFFKEHDVLVATCEDEALDRRIKDYAAVMAKKTPPPPDFPILAAEPSDGAVSAKNFYLLPVLSVDMRFKDSTRLLEVASIHPGTGGPKVEKQPMPKADPSLYRTGFVFVIDTTISMKPYIDQTLKLVRTIYDKLEKNPHGDKIALAVVAFRNNTQRSPGLGYTAKVICDFKNVRERKALEDALAQVEEATVSSHSFSEDSFAGLKEAVDHLDWRKYGSRAMLLVSDAGPLRENDRASATGFSPGVMADYLKTNGIYLTVVHLKSPTGKKNHEPAAKAYREVSKQADNSASYIPLDAGSSARGAAQFDRVGRQLTDGYNRMATATAEGRMLPPPTPKSVSRPLTPEEEAARIAEATGYAMQLRFFGTREGNTAPSVVRAWIADADLEHLARTAGREHPVLAVEPAILLTKNQLSDLRAQLKIILDNAERTKFEESRNFFQGILSAAAQMSRDPARIKNVPGQSLADSGVLGEFLEGLPYTSRVMSMTENDWYSMTTGQQYDFIDNLRALIARYDAYDRDNTHWESFGAKNPGEWVYRVPLAMLP